MDERRSNGVGGWPGRDEPATPGRGLVGAAGERRASGSGRWHGRGEDVAVAAGVMAICGMLCYLQYQARDIRPARFVYLPVILACFWFGWRGFALPALLAASIVTTRSMSAPGGGLLGLDWADALIVLLAGALIAALKQRHLRDRRKLQRLEARWAQDVPDAGVSAGPSECGASQPGEEAVRASESSLNPSIDTVEVLDSLVEHVLRFDPNMSILWANRAAFEAVGLSRETIVGKHCYDLWTQAGEPCPDCPVLEAMKTGQPQATEKCSADGRQWSLRGYPVRDVHANIIGGAKVALDITEAGRLERERAAERNLLRTLIDNLPDAVYVKDRHSRFVLCNSEVLRRKGCSTVDEMIGKTDHDFYPHDVAEQVYEAEQELMAGGRPIVNQERWVIDKESGVRTWNLTTKVPLTDEQGEIVGLVGIGRDITDRKRAEEAYRALVDHSLQGLVVIQDERVVFANSAMSAISGYGVDEILTKSSHDLWNFVHPNDRRRVYENHRARLDGHRPPENYELQIVRKDGTVRWLELHACRIEYQGRPAIHATCTDVTERVLAQQALQHSEARTHALLDAIPDLIFRLNGEGVFLDFRPAQGYGLTLLPQEFLGRPAEDLLPESVARPLMKAIAEVLATGQVQTFEYELITPSGTLDEECRLVAYGDDEVIAIVRNIADRKRAERLSRITHDLAVKLNVVDDVRKGARLCLEAAIEASQSDCGAVYLLDETSGQMKLLTHRGLSGDLSPSLLCVGRDCAQMRLLAKGRSLYYDADERGMPLSPAQRRAGLASYAALPIRDEHTFIGTLIVASRCREPIDRQCRPALETIAAQTATTLARLHAEEALAASERNYREIFNAANEAIFVHDPATGTIVDVNRTGLDMFGYCQEELRQMNVGDLRAEPPVEARQSIRRWFDKAVQEGPQVFEWLCRRNDGYCFWVEMDLKQASIGGCDRLLAVARDITERIQAARAAENHRVELTRAWHANTLGEMASGLAHELNQPLCAIVNYAGGCRRLAGRDPVDLHMLQDTIEQIAGQAERAAGIIRRIRSLVAKREPQRGSLEIHAVLDETMRMMEAEIARLEITVVRNLAEDLPAVAGDAVGLQQVMLNLVRNALEAMSASHTSARTLTLSTRLIQDGAAIEIAVADTGRALSPQLVDRVFDSFFTTKNDGLGIGLSLSRRIVEAHGGRLWGQSDGCTHTIFRFTLPAEGAQHEQHKPHCVCGR